MRRSNGYVDATYRRISTRKQTRNRTNQTQDTQIQDHSESQVNLFDLFYVLVGGGKTESQSTHVVFFVVHRL